MDRVLGVGGEKKKRWREPRQSLHPLVQELNPQRKLLINIQFVQGCSKCVQFCIYCTFGAYPWQPCGGIPANQITGKLLPPFSVMISSHQTTAQPNLIQTTSSFSRVLIWVDLGFDRRRDRARPRQREGSFICCVTGNTVLNGRVSHPLLRGEEERIKGMYMLPSHHVYQNETPLWVPISSTCGVLNLYMRGEGITRLASQIALNPAQRAVDRGLRFVKALRSIPSNHF